jgi:hypothetical protein
MGLINGIANIIFLGKELLHYAFNGIRFVGRKLYNILKKIIKFLCLILEELITFKFSSVLFNYP